MAQPIVKYTLNKKGQVPEWINTSSNSFAGLHGITGNKTGCIPRYESPQDNIYLGIASGDPDSDGTPDDYMGSDIILWWIINNNIHKAYSLWCRNSCNNFFIYGN